MSASSIGQTSVSPKNIASLLEALSKPNDGDADDGNSKSSAPAKAALPPGVGQVVDKLA
ncbi:hypothetical protein [Bradyrhizobium japonicum]|uniref:hypothetical protein n=1 Tax=Bradyrhizobium japonicum TaxID=375 RepID=UPI0027155EBB|nr:hypothetical protein [Bradyrhizobium japonicum]WLB23935.1 hypothetical protein QIH95_49105 [Bradyrhizobium japonicum]